MVLPLPGEIIDGVREEAEDRGPKEKRDISASVDVEIGVGLEQPLKQCRTELRSWEIHSVCRGA
eukprot:595444-Amorphochlora_amoeboformis.AAC.1